jgi:hypothetical protein
MPIADYQMHAPHALHMTDYVFIFCKCSRLPDLGLLLGLAFWGLLGRSSSFWRGITGSSFSRVGEGNKAPSAVTKSLVLSDKICPGYLFQIQKFHNWNLWLGVPKELWLNSHVYVNIKYLTFIIHERKIYFISRIWGSHGSEYEDGCPLGCSAMQSGRSFRGPWCLHHHHSSP